MCASKSYLLDPVSLFNINPAYPQNRIPFYCCFVGENQTKVLKLSVIEDLLEALIEHKTNADACVVVSLALESICESNGIVKRKLLYWARNSIKFSCMAVISTFKGDKKIMIQCLQVKI